jgi:hypothetical protein
MSEEDDVKYLAEWIEHAIDVMGAICSELDSFTPRVASPDVRKQFGGSSDRLRSLISTGRIAREHVRPVTSRQKVVNLAWLKSQVSANAAAMGRLQLLIRKIVDKELNVTWIETELAVEPDDWMLRHPTRERGQTWTITLVPVTKDTDTTYAPLQRPPQDRRELK